MLIITILTLIVAIGLQNTQQSKITPILFSRITSIMLIYAAILTFNMLYIDIIDSGLGIFSGYLQVSNISLSLEIFIYIIGALILMPWYPNIFNNKLILERDSPSASPSTLSLLVGDLKSDSEWEKANVLKLESPSTFSHQINEWGISLNDNKVDNISITHLGDRWENFYDRVVKYNRPVLSEYALIILFTTLGGVLLISSYDLVSMYLSIELQSFALYLLASLYRDSESATSAGLKYFLLGGLSSCFILLGAGLIYAYTGLTNLEALYSLFSVPNITDTIVSDSHLHFMVGAGESNIYGHRGFLLGLILIVSGFLFKIAAAPFHNWAPDVYDQVPTIITTWLTIVPKIAIIIFLLELESGLFINSDISNITNDIHSLSLLNISIDNIITLDGNILKNLFLFSSLLSLIIGTVLGLAQYKIKRLLAYSTISHVGFLVLALAVNTEQSTESLIFYIFQYSVTNLNTFLIILVFGYSLNTFWKNNNTNLNIKSNLDIRYISELKAQFINNPILSLSLAICLFSMAGVPPLIGFFAKQQVLYSATYSGYYFLSIVAILVSVISASYYLQIIKVIHFPISMTNIQNDSNSLKVLENNSNNKLNNKSNNIVPITNIHSMTISILTLTILLFILNPSILLNSTHILALSIFNC
uniref:NADH-ubiquinone oxidoreductase chain 2 n=1 Tax=Cantharellus cibarius TaxID=36066 RepID=M1K4G7_CANCI|nr:NADH dehydrogenase subunit 2 [Cantharellus cibarius]AGE93544.1 NADH dehydrogenase subunit 2 [Cantharellus cibarius]